MKKAILIVVAALVALGIVGSLANGSKKDESGSRAPAASNLSADAGTTDNVDAAPAAVRPTTAPTYRLSLISASCTVEYGYNKCEGFVQNVTDQAIKNVEAVISWFDANGNPQKADSAIIDYNPILAGQKSPWSVIGTSNPGLTKFSVTFKDLLGPTITTRDDRPGH